MNTHYLQPIQPPEDRAIGSITLMTLGVPSASQPPATSLWDPTLLDRLSTPISRIHE